MIDSNSCDMQTYKWPFNSPFIVLDFFLGWVGMLIEYPLGVLFFKSAFCSSVRDLCEVSGGVFLFFKKLSLMEAAFTPTLFSDKCEFQTILLLAVDIFLSRTLVCFDAFLFVPESDWWCCGDFSNLRISSVSLGLVDWKGYKRVGG